MSAPGLRLHKRTMPVQAASADLGMRLVRFQQEHDLTDVEMLVILAEQQQRILKYRLRDERHPDDPDRKADEALWQATPAVAAAQAAPASWACSV